MKDHKMQKKSQGRPFTQPPPREQKKKLDPLGLVKDSSTWTNSVSLPKCYDLICDCKRCIERKSGKELHDL